VRVTRARGWWCGGGKLAVRDVAQLTARYVVGGGDLTGGYVRGVVVELRRRGAGGGGG